MPVEDPAAYPRWGLDLRYGPAMADQTPAAPVDFSTHVLSLGKMPGPDGQPHPVDLETARHLIDVLAMLETKTKGNLEEAEAKLLASLVYDLRVAAVDVQHTAKK